VWQRALAVMHLHGVVRSPAEAASHANMLCQDWRAPGHIANCLVLQRCLGLSGSDAYKQFGGRVATAAPTKLAGRLLYLEQRGLLHLVVPDRRAAKRAWREEHGPSAIKRATSDPRFITVGNVANLSTAKFTRLLQQHLPGAAADFAAFKAGLQDSPAWQQLWGEAQAESARLLALLPPELQPGWRQESDDDDDDHLLGDDAQSRYAKFERDMWSRRMELMIRGNGY
jgi:hypothetical protein